MNTSDNKLNPSQPNKVKLTKDVLSTLMRQVEQTKEGMYSCKETFDLLDEYIDYSIDNEDAAKLMPLVKAHLDACPPCTQQYEVLQRILEATSTDE